MKPCRVANRESRLLGIGVAAEAFEQTRHGTHTPTSWNTKSVLVCRTVVGGAIGIAGPALRFRSDDPAGTLQERFARRSPNRWMQLGTVRGSFRPLEAGTLAHETLRS